MVRRSLNPTLSWLVLASLAALFVTPELRVKADLKAMLAPISWAHPLGCDPMGRDLLLRLIQGVQQTLVPLWGCILLAYVCGGFAFMLPHVGASNSHQVFKRCLINLSGLLTAVPLSLWVFIAALAAGHAQFQGVLASLFGFFVARTFLQLEAMHLEDVKLGYWLAHEATGGSSMERIWHYGILGRWRPSLESFLLEGLYMASIIEITLSYLGYGNQEPRASFGNIIAMYFPHWVRGDCLLMFQVFLPMATAIWAARWAIAAQLHHFGDKKGTSRVADPSYVCKL